MTPGETGGCEEVLLFRAPQAAIHFFVCVAAYGALQLISTCLAPGFTRSHSCIAPSELHFIYTINLSVKSVEFALGRLKLFRIKGMILQKEPRRGETIVTPVKPGGMMKYWNSEPRRRRYKYFDHADHRRKDTLIYFFNLRDFPVRIYGNKKIKTHPPPDLSTAAR